VLETWKIRRVSGSEIRTWFSSPRPKDRNRAFAGNVTTFVAILVCVSVRILFQTTQLVSQTSSFGDERNRCVATKNLERKARCEINNWLQSKFGTRLRIAMMSRMFSWLSITLLRSLKTWWINRSKCQLRSLSNSTYEETPTEPRILS